MSSLWPIIDKIILLQPIIDEMLSRADNGQDLCSMHFMGHTVLYFRNSTFLDMKASFSGVRKGLGFYSEQSVESIHSDWKYFWEKYKVPDEHPKYLDQLKLAVIAYNAKHL